MRRNQRFKARKSKAVFTCCHCGRQNLTWREYARNKWIPFDENIDDFHTCIRGETQNLTKYQLTSKLEKAGFKRFLTKNPNYQYAYAIEKFYGSLIFLFKKRGIDINYSWQSLIIKEAGQLSVPTGVQHHITNYYYKSEVNLHQLVLELALSFITHRKVDNRFLRSYGKDWHVQQKDYCEEKGIPKRKSIIEYYDHDGMPDSAFTEDELAAGVQWIVRTGKG